MSNRAHKIADAIACVSNGDKEPLGIIQIDEWEQIAETLKRFNGAVLT